MRNKWINLQKSRSRETHPEEGVPDLPDTSGEPLSRLIEDEKRRSAAEMIAKLPERQKIIMVESIFLDRSDDQIAEALGLTAANVRKIRSRARKTLTTEREKENER